MFKEHAEKEHKQGRKNALHDFVHDYRSPEEASRALERRKKDRFFHPQDDPYEQGYSEMLGELIRERHRAPSHTRTR
jgi:hypothetical protein